RVFVSQADDIARGLHGMTRLAPSPAVSRAVMSAVREEQSGWAWLRQALQALSSPGMAAAASMALVVALAGVLYVAVNAPNRAPTPIVSQATQPEETISAVADVPLPTAIPTKALETPEPEQPKPQNLALAPTKAPEPTATREPRTIEPAATKAPTVAPTPAPTTAAPEQPAIQPVADTPAIQPVSGEEPVYEEPAVEEPALAMADEPAAETAPVEIAQEVAPEAVDTGEAPAEEVTAAQGAEPEPVVEQTNSAPEDTGDNSSQGGATGGESAAPEPTRPVGPVPLEAIAALEGAGDAPDIHLPPAPMNPILPDQSFLPVTPTPVTDGTPTPEQSQEESSGEPTGSQAPQLAEAYEDSDPGIAALIPEGALDDAALAEPVVETPDDTWTETTDSRNRNGKDKKDRKNGGSYENQQTAYVEEPLAWSGLDNPLTQQAIPVDLQQEAAPAELQQETGYPATEQPVYDDGTIYSDGAATDDGTGYADPVASGESGTMQGEAEPERQIDPATGMEIDPATGYLIDPTTGYLLDRVNGRVIDPRTSYEVHLQTGLLIDPATGAL
ncbi:MAG: hypothetical protein KC442_05765, partial [Thermomicrobiales bacterium]|nr:hypothetical protein [Thermomicrobiales bacterium]